ncbi:MAG: hypothetical protein AB1650_01390 [Candidatus Omnitrophota bacterium]
MSKITSDKLRHGEKQVKTMLANRPVMKAHVTQTDVVWKWAAKKFAGEYLGVTIDWNSEEPYHNADADHVYPTSKERGFIRVKKFSGPFAFELSWSRAIFELNNRLNYKLTKKIIRKTYSGRLGKKEFIIEMAKVEFKSILATEKFYKEIWEKWSNKKGLWSCPGEWYVGVPKKFSDWLKYYDKKSTYPWKIYSDFYDDHLEEWALANTRK